MRQPEGVKNRDNNQTITNYQIQITKQPKRFLDSWPRYDTGPNDLRQNDKAGLGARDWGLGIGNDKRPRLITSPICCLSPPQHPQYHDFTVAVINVVNHPVVAYSDAVGRVFRL